MLEADFILVLVLALVLVLVLVKGNQEFYAGHGDSDHK